ncbi:MAG: hypothetical protein KY450_01860 [Actinobacteria bacterium]|nr:hypothetical protein [Actinomycetota bacterium]
MPEQESKKTAEWREPAVDAAEWPLNWRAGKLLCIGTAIGYTLAAWIESLASGM